jgi:Thioredoxin-like [2Fe-2S] ferredoxin
MMSTATISVKPSPAAIHSPSIVGRFLSCDVKHGHKIKRLHLLTQQGIQVIKLSKTAKAALSSLAATLKQGTLLELRVRSKEKKGSIRYKADDVWLFTGFAEGLAELPDPPNTAACITTRPEPPLTVQICNRGTCRKRGAREIQAAFGQALDAHGLAGAVCVETVGCLNHCKQGPNLKIDGVRYRHVEPEQVDELVADFCCPAAVGRS